MAWLMLPESGGFFSVHSYVRRGYYSLEWGAGGRVEVGDEVGMK
jgi:hypothetical protein